MTYNTTPDNTTDQPAETSFSGTPGNGQARKVFKVIRNDQLLLPIPVHPGALVVPKWDTTGEVPGWTLTGAEIDMHHQSLLWGQLLYTRETDGRRVRVGVRWNPQQFGLEAQCLDSTELTGGPALPLEDTDGIDTDALEMSTLRRAQRLVELNSFIGSVVANPASQDVILQSAGLGLTRLPHPDNWTTAEEADGADGDGRHDG
ncbi:hypothetical protein AS850_00305 [Frondihabitans sp. 762G35]|uniref:hypothetical protein n=1 Tax=Frondihabitans sp. 762G35 TaxID=1446794 RepID=UPI000D223933|nr:hypothetical protein [Frondihabitans sp. 762G35]ARC55516.1 hypothetical protein AS850_00305 [Frondihabitans sp. 762G35]